MPAGRVLRVLKRRAHEVVLEGLADFALLLHYSGLAQEEVVLVSARLGLGLQLAFLGLVLVGLNSVVPGLGSQDLRLHLRLQQLLLGRLVQKFRRWFLHHGAARVHHFA